MKRIVFTALGAALAPALFAAEMQIGIDLPRIETAQYQRPYVAVWVERPDNSVAADLAVWYDVKMRNGEGTKWLKDIRQWWRRSGREMRVPVDGVTSATRPPGTQHLTFRTGTPPLGQLAAGDYRLVVEAAREHGGREVLTVPFVWPPATAETIVAEGREELGAVVLELKP